MENRYSVRNYNSYSASIVTSNNYKIELGTIDATGLILTPGDVYDFSLVRSTNVILNPVVIDLKFKTSSLIP